MSRARDLADRVLHNRTHEDTEGGRESILTFKGEQSGGEISTLAQIQASHDGTSDDEKADLIFKTNDGSDGASPTERMRIDSDGNIGVNINAPSSMLHLFDGGTDTGITLQSKVQANATSSLTMMSRDASNVNQTLTLKNIKGRLQSSAGIMFGSDTAVENALDDYEYGTFSPTYSTSASDQSGVTYTVYNTGSYVKIGNVVHFQFQLSINAMTSAGSGSPRIGGLPYNTSSSAPLNEGTRYPVSTYNVDYITSTSAGYIMQAYFPTSGVNYLQFLLTQDAYAWAVLSTSQFTLSAGDYVTVMGTYFAN